MSSRFWLGMWYKVQSVDTLSTRVGIHVTQVLASPTVYGVAGQYYRNIHTHLCTCCTSRLHFIPLGQLVPH